MIFNIEPMLFNCSCAGLSYFIAAWSIVNCQSDCFKVKFVTGNLKKSMRESGTNIMCEINYQTTSATRTESDSTFINYFTSS
ncbi:Uncharacterised protein [Citrobacter amalonaticus]|uniref:Uncharacterized protein n=1 Tax=Citrobacter amalonaticus TaxID=35703 RepID=A0A6N2S7U6_CITAM